MYGNPANSSTASFTYLRVVPAIACNIHKRTSVMESPMVGTFISFFSSSGSVAVAMLWRPRRIATRSPAVSAILDDMADTILCGSAGVSLHSIWYGGGQQGRRFALRRMLGGQQKENLRRSWIFRVRQKRQARAQRKTQVCLSTV